MNSLVSLAIGLVASGLADEAGERIATIASSDSATEIRAASEWLKSADAQLVAPALAAALQEDGGFRVAWRRYAAYEALAGIRSIEPNGTEVISDPDQIAQLVAGLSDSDVGCRAICLAQMSSFAAPFRRLAADESSRLLADDDPDVISLAAQTLGELGTKTEVVMTGLLELLADPKPRRAVWWAEARGDDRIPNRDIELVARTNAAFARIQILDTYGEIELYRNLDQRGQAAGASAASGKILVDLATGDCSVVSLQRPIDWLVDYVINGSAPPERVSTHVLQSLALIAQRSPDETSGVRDWAIGLIEDIATAENVVPTVRSAAAKLREDF